MANNQTVIILDFGAQYRDLIARRVRECGVYSVVLPAESSVDTIRSYAPIGIILSGGPNSVYDSGSRTANPEILHLGIPVLGICYGMQYIAHSLGGTVLECTHSEYGVVDAEVTAHSTLLGECGTRRILMSHTDRVSAVPQGFSVVASSTNCPIVAMENDSMRIYGLQFHPEVELTVDGISIIHTFLYDCCGAVGDYTLTGYLEQAIADIRAQVGDRQVLLGLSGGVDSSVVAALLARAIPDRTVCVFIDHGLLRQNEGDEVERIFADYPLRFVRDNCADDFLTALRGVTEPEQKRKIIGREFVTAFRRNATALTGEFFLAQGTIYPDIIESGSTGSAVIKSHHNVGGLPKELGFLGLVEPLRGLFKDEVRRLGTLLGLPDTLVNRQPFPGPGLGVRIIGEVTAEKLDMLRRADYIFRTELQASGEAASQYFAVLTDLRSVGVMGDGRTYDYTLALRAVLTGDFMTADYAPLSHRLLSRVSARIVDEVRGISRVVYDITGKPPATIEWE